MSELRFSPTVPPVNAQLAQHEGIFSRSSGEEQSTFGQNSTTNLKGTKKERKTHKGQLNGRKRNDKRSRKEREKERKRKSSNTMYPGSMRAVPISVTADSRNICS
jgi:hypothetical protein